MKLHPLIRGCRYEMLQSAEACQTQICRNGGGLRIPLFDAIWCIHCFRGKSFSTALEPPRWAGEKSHKYILGRGEKWSMNKLFLTILADRPRYCAGWGAVSNIFRQTRRLARGTSALGKIRPMRSSSDVDLVGRRTDTILPTTLFAPTARAHRRAHGLGAPAETFWRRTWRRIRYRRATRHERPGWYFARASVYRQCQQPRFRGPFLELQHQSDL